MISISAKLRGNKKPNALRKEGVLPAVLYGPKIKNLSLEVDAKSFEKIYQQAGRTSLISLEIKGGGEEKFLVLIQDVQSDPLTDNLLNVDFYQPSLKQETEAKIPLVFEGEALAVKELGGTLIKRFQEIEVRALPQNFPHEIRVDVSGLKTFKDNILIKDLRVSEGVKILKKMEEIVALVVPAEKVEEELEKPIEEKVEEVEKAGEGEEEKEKEKEAPETEEKEEEKKKNV